MSFFQELNVVLSRCYNDCYLVRDHHFQNNFVILFWSSYGEAVEKTEKKNRCRNIIMHCPFVEKMLSNITIFTRELQN